MPPAPATAGFRGDDGECDTLRFDGIFQQKLRHGKILQWQLRRALPDLPRRQDRS